MRVLLPHSDKYFRRLRLGRAQPTAHEVPLGLRVMPLVGLLTMSITLLGHICQEPRELVLEAKRLRIEIIWNLHHA